MFLNFFNYYCHDLILPIAGLDSQSYISTGYEYNVYYIKQLNINFYISEKNNLFALYSVIGNRHARFILSL